ncbi:MAG: DcaP family trimeric outer membrane transporter [Holophaga sp.]|jgi:hypothetical protein
MSRIRNLTTALAAVLLVGAPSLRAADFQSGDTKMSVYGFVWAQLNYWVDAIPNNSEGETAWASSFFYSNWSNLAGQPNNQFEFARQPTRFGFASTTPSGIGDIGTKIEYDLNTSTSHVRHANITIGNWTFGQQWSLWNDFDAAPDNLDWAGPVGLACFDTPRHQGVNWTSKLDKNDTLGFSLEQPTGNGGDGAIANGTAYTKDDFKVPTLTGMYSYSDSWGHVRVSALGQTWGSYKPATATTSKDRENKMYWAVMLSGDFKIAKDDLVWSVYQGKALGDYGLGAQAAVWNDAQNTVDGIQNIGYDIGYTHNWTDAVRSNIIVSGVVFKSSSDDAYLAAATDGTKGTLMKTGTQVFVNTYVMLAKNLQFGVEYLWSQAKSFGSDATQVGWLDGNANAVTKNTSSKIAAALKCNF